jgi:hypothetical protein
MSKLYAVVTILFWCESLGCSGEVYGIHGFFLRLSLPMETSFDNSPHQSRSPSQQTNPPTTISHLSTTIVPRMLLLLKAEKETAQSSFFFFGRRK